LFEAAIESLLFVENHLPFLFRTVPGLFNRPVCIEFVIKVVGDVDFLTCQSGLDIKEDIFFDLRLVVPCDLATEGVTVVDHETAKGMTK